MSTCLPDAGAVAGKKPKLGNKMELLEVPYISTRDDYLLAAQGEYRWNFHEKMSAVGFFGLDTIYGSINKGDNGKLLSGNGPGFRYNIFSKYYMNAGLDVAVEKDGWGIYFKVGVHFNKLKYHGNRE